MNNQPSEISTYIQLQLSQGISEGDIRNHLVQSGWPQPAVDQAFAEYHSQLPTPGMAQPTPATPVKKGFSNRNKIIVGVIAIVIIAAIAVGGALLASPKTTQKLATPALKQNADKTSQLNDIDMIASTVSNYIGTNSGNLPATAAVNSKDHTLYICGTDCTGTTKTSTTLGYYKDAEDTIIFQTYRTNLTAPNNETVYIVNNATCNPAKTGLTSEPAAAQNRSVAILYEVGTTDQCLNI